MQYEKQQQWEMEVFAEQQLKNKQYLENQLQTQTAMANLQLQDQPNQVQQHELLPQDFFITSEQSHVVENNSVQAPDPQYVSPQIDLLTPQPPPLSTPDKAPALSLLDITPEDLSQHPPEPTEPVVYSHLSALTPPNQKVLIISHFCIIVLILYYLGITTKRYRL
jgi:hypothetical protein